MFIFLNFVSQLFPFESKEPSIFVGKHKIPLKSNKKVDFKFSVLHFSFGRGNPKIQQNHV